MSNRHSESERLRRRRNKLWEANGGKCHWCGCETILPPVKRLNRESIPENEATIDHLRSNFDVSRQEPCHNNEERTVLACRKCNMRRAREEEIAIGIDALRELGKHIGDRRSKKEILQDALERKKADSGGSVERNEAFSFSAPLH